MNNATFSNAAWKKIKKIQAISWNPVNIFYDVLTTQLAGFGFVKPVIRQLGANGQNNALQHRQFKPVETAKFTIENFYAPDGAQQCQQLLSKYGVCLINNFVQTETAKLAGEEIKAFLQENNFVTDNGQVQAPDRNCEFSDEPLYQWQSDLARYKNYQEIVNAGKPVINIRSQKTNEPDSGMVDVFCVEDIAKALNMSNLQACYEAAREQKMDDFLRQISGYGVRQSNLYYNAGVVNTRGPHIDNNSEQYKIFIYLTDVLCEENGPYCYVPGSHKQRNWMSRERVLSSANGYPSTEVSSFPRQQATKLLAPAGTAIISCQSGIHFGWQQSEAGRRIVLVGNYN